MAWRIKKRRRTRSGKSRQDKHYTLYYKLPEMLAEKPIALGVSDKQVAEKKGRGIYERLERIAAGLEVEEAATPLKLADLLGQYIKEKESENINAQYLSDLKNRNKRLICECAWVYTEDIKPGDFTAWRAENEEDLRPKTRNDYLDAVVGFTKWLYQGDYLASLPFEKVKKVSKRGKQVERDCFTVEEFGRLLAVAGERQVLYLAAALTSFRRGVLYKLQWCHAHMDASKPIFVVPASIEKNASENHKLIHKDLLGVLQKLRGKDYDPKARIFENLLPRWNIDFLRSDMAKAGIPEVRANGKVLVFHSLRHTACTWAFETGVSHKEVQHFMNHKTPTQTEHYDHTKALVSEKVIGLLPRFADQILAGPYGTESGTGIGTEPIVKKGADVSQTGLCENGGNAVKPLEVHKKTALTSCQSGFNRMIPTGFEPVFSG